MDKKITQIEQNIAAQAIIPPPKVFSYMEGKEVVSEEEGLEIKRLFFEWAELVVKALKSKSVTFEQVLDEIPEPYRTGLVEALIKDS
jgi:hypothetical protein